MGLSPRRVVTPRVSRIEGGRTSSLWSPHLPISSSRVYTLSYALRTDDATWYPRVVLWQYGRDGAETGPNLLAYANIDSGASDWQAVHYQFQSMPDAAQLQVQIYLDTDTTGSFWLDDFALDQGPPALYPFLAGFPVVASGAAPMSSPAVADIDFDGHNEVLIAAGNDVNGWDDRGAVLPGFPLDTRSRQIIGDIALADLDGDLRLEIVAGTRALLDEGQCQVFVWQDSGALLPGWPKAVNWEPKFSANNCWVSSVAISDLDGDRDLEIIAGTTNNGAIDPYAGIPTPNLYAWHVDGRAVRGDWPNWQTTAGVYGALAIGDITKDGKADVVVGRDYLYLNAYGHDGRSLSGWPIRTFVNGNGGDYDSEQRIEYSVNAPAIADLDADSVPEIIVAGHVKGPGNADEKRNSAVLVLEPDGTRRRGWEIAALGKGILAQVDLPRQGIAIADLDSDGRLDIVVATHDGWIRAYRHDKTVLWAFNYARGDSLFATDPVIGDVDGDGRPEVLFGTYVPDVVAGHKDGPVAIWGLEANGVPRSGFPLTIPTPGVSAPPTLTDLDKDGDVEIVAVTRNGQLFVWTTAAPYHASRFPWPTSRHDVQRSALYPPAPASVDLALLYFPAVCGAETDER